MAELLTNSTSITFGTSGWTAAITGFSDLGGDRPVIDTTSLSTTVARSKIAGALVDNGELGITFLFDPDEPPPITGAAETVTITFRTPSGQSSGATAVFTGFFSSYKVSGEEGALLQGTGSVAVNGAITWTDSS